MLFGTRLQDRSQVQRHRQSPPRASGAPAWGDFLPAIDDRTQRARSARGFAASVLEEKRIEPTYAISASIGRANALLPQLRCLCEPDVLAFIGGERAAR
jgi:hypothetical protein